MSYPTRPGRGIADLISSRLHLRRSRRMASACIEALEQRQLLSTVTLGDIPASQAIPQKKSLIVPLTASDSDGLPLTYTVTSSNKSFKVLYHKNVTFLKLGISTQPNSQWSANQQAITGTLTFELFKDIAPKTVGYITGLVNAGFYNNLQFFRMDDLSGGQGSTPQVILQGGSPSNNGTGGPGFQFEDEFNQNTIFSGTGQLAMANSGPDTNGSQFFFTFAPTRGLDFGYTIFGQLVNSQNTTQDATTDFMTALSNIGFHKETDAQTQQSLSKPNQTITITSAQMVQDTQDAAVTILAPGGGGSTITVKAADSKGAIATKTFQVFAKKDVKAQNQPINDPPFFKPSPRDAVVPVSTATNMGRVSFNLKAFDFENDKPVWGGGFLNGTHAYAVLEGNMLTVVPYVGYKGPIVLKMTVTETGATKSTPDSEIVTIAVGGKSFTDVHGLDVRPTAGTSATFDVATFRHNVAGAKVSDYKASINWGDGQVANGTIVKGPKGTWIVRGTNSYKTEAVYPINVLISDKLGVIAKTVSSATVGDGPLTPAATPTKFFGTAGTAFTNLTVGSFTDGDTNGKATDFSGSINWGDGTAPTAISSSNFTSRGSGKFDITSGHTYATAGSYNVAITVRDSGGASATVTSTAAVGRSTLTVSPGTAPSTFNEGDTLNQTGTFSDTDASVTNWTATVDYGDGSAVQNLVLNNKSYTLNHQFLNSGSYTIRVVVTDQNGISSSGTMSLTAANLPPSMTGLSGDATAIAQQPYNISFSATDISPKDNTNGFYFKVDWGDGTTSSPDTQFVSPKNTTASHNFAPGTYTIAVTALDQEGADSSTNTDPSAQKKTIQVTVDKSGLSQGNLYIGGSANADKIKLVPGATGQIDVQFADASGNYTTESTWNLASITAKIQINGGAGDDTITVDPGITRGVEIIGGDGNDTLTGGGGNDLIIGGAGNDVISGGAGRNILLGGAGSDSLIGGSGEDILVAGTSKYESSLPTLELYMKEWESGRSYADRVNRLTVAGTAFSGKYIISNKTVTDDNVADTLVGGSGSDLYVARTKQVTRDVLRDRRSTETLIEI